MRNKLLFSNGSEWKDCVRDEILLECSGEVKKKKYIYIYIYKEKEKKKINSFAKYQIIPFFE